MLSGAAWNFFFPLKIRCCFFDIFNIYLVVIPYFANVNWWERYTNVNLTKKNIMLTFYENRDTTPCLEITFRLTQNLKLMHDIKLYITWVGFSIICEYQSEDMRESITWLAELVMLSFHQFEQRALKFLWQLNN